MTNPAAVATPAVDPPPFVPLVVYMRCTENRVEDDYDGGLLLLQANKGQLPELAGEILDGRLVLSFAHDEPMREFPITREQKQNRFFRLTVEEVAYADVPPDPDAPPALFNAGGQRVDARGNLLR